MCTWNDNQAKFWLEPARLQRNVGFRASELRQIERIIREQQTFLLEAWNEYLYGRNGDTERGAGNVER